MTLRMFVGAVGSGARLIELALDLGMHKETFISIGALGEILARLGGVDKLALAVEIAAFGPKRALYFHRTLPSHL